MLRFQSVFWATGKQDELSQKLARLGFGVTASQWDQGAQSIYFGPESIELFNGKLTTLSETSDSGEFIQKGDGIFGMGLESSEIVADYHRLKNEGEGVEKPRRSPEAIDNMPQWFGFNLPKNLTPMLRTWVVMYSPAVLNQQAHEVLPRNHPNTCFGIESVHAVTKDPEPVATQWAKVMEKPVAGLQWKELVNTSGKRIQAGERFFDTVSQEGSGALSTAAHGREGIFMLTLKVEDLEGAKKICQAAGAKITNCHNRDGFMIPSEFTGGPILRMVRSYWKRYLPVINENFPWGRRTDKFRPLGGAYSTTLEEGFGDNWKY